MIHARLLGSTLTFTIGMGATLAVASLPFARTEVLTVVLAVFVISCSSAYWLSCRSDRSRARRSWQERHRQSEEESRCAYELHLESWARRSEVRGGTVFEPRMVEAFLRVLERAPRTD